MPLEFAGDRQTTRAIDWARAVHETGAETGTDHLLAGLVFTESVARDVLDAFDITRTVVVAVLTGRAEGRDAADGVDRVDTEVTVESCTLTGGANAALVRYLEQPEPRGPETLLGAILRDDRSHAAILLRDCGVDVDEVRRAVRAGERPRVSDRVAPELRATRDLLVGRARYPGAGLRNLSLTLAVRLRPNYGTQPTIWATLEADRLARRRGGRTRTDDVLVAMLATYRVATAYPHLLRTVPELYEGVRALVAAGIDPEDAARAAESFELGRDAVPPKSLIRYGEHFPKDTAALLRLLAAHDDNRSARLLRALGVDPKQFA